MSSLRQVVARWVALALVWWVVSEGDEAALAVGVATAFLAAWVSFALYPGRFPRVRLLGVCRYAAFFLAQSVLGGVDVALRALRPDMPLDPRCVDYRLRLEPVAYRVLLANTLSLLPGTLSAQLEGDTLVVHVLDCRRDVMGDITKVEDRVADLAGLELAPAGGG